MVSRCRYNYRYYNWWLSSQPNRYFDGCKITFVQRQFLTWVVGFRHGPSCPFSPLSISIHLRTKHSSCRGAGRKSEVGFSLRSFQTRHMKLNVVYEFGDIAFAFQIRPNYPGNHSDQLNILVIFRSYYGHLRALILLLIAWSFCFHHR